MKFKDVRKGQIFRFENYVPEGHEKSRNGKRFDYCVEGLDPPCLIAVELIGQIFFTPVKDLPLIHLKDDLKAQLADLEVIPVKTKLYG